MLKCLLGARAVDPSITCQVIFTGEWSLAVKEAEATNASAHFRLGVALRRRYEAPRGLPRADCRPCG